MRPKRWEAALLCAAHGRHHHSLWKKKKKTWFQTDALCANHIVSFVIFQVRGCPAALQSLRRSTCNSGRGRRIPPKVTSFIAAINFQFHFLSAMFILKIRKRAEAGLCVCVCVGRGRGDSALHRLCIIIRLPAYLGLFACLSVCLSALLIDQWLAGETPVFPAQKHFSQRSVISVRGNNKSNKNRSLD